MPTDADMLNELRIVMSKVNETMGKLTTYSSSIERMAEDRATVATLKEKLQELKQSVDELYDLLQKDSNSPAILTRLGKIENALTAINSALVLLETSTKVLPDIQSKIHDFEKDCTICRKSVEARLDAIEEEKEEDKKDRKEYSRNLKMAIAAAVASQVVTWILAGMGYFFMQAQQTQMVNASPSANTSTVNK